MHLVGSYLAGVFAKKHCSFHNRQLLTGVDNLKLISDVLASVDKITEDDRGNRPPDGPGGGDPEGAVGGATGGSNT